MSTGRSPCFTLRTFLTVPSPTTLYTPALALARLLAKLTILLVWVTRLLALGLSALVFALHSKARRCILPNRVRYPTDWSFASGCSPPHLTVTQLPSATELDVTLNRTCTDLICNTHRRTNASVSLARFYQPLAGFFMTARRWQTFPVRHRNSACWNSTALSGF